MTISEGQSLPEAKLMLKTEDGIADRPLSEITKGRSVVIFGLPGAFTGTCSNAHVPSFMRTLPKFKEKGVDEVICVSVNDVFVMEAWGKQTGATAAGITFASDPDASFTQALGLSFDAGFVRGLPRSHRYALHAVDGVVKVLNLETNPGACDISAGEGLLQQL
ncbi:peroxiredoxin [Stagnihabitans tardus]|uniref:Glutathione-dependent peroxiredoxin n=1 Tax=Stagnihabitans tardus TaxID=2699202 RepID=A0AAE5BW32_9RHOB|nr:peroxiredoxin [Stagnihabitans tardus]NBZ88399.1 redoxin family protein [Stagnihabitans tardus]